MSENNLNPDIRRVKVGIRTLREIDVLPLSYADEKRVRAEIWPNIAGKITEFMKKPDHEVIEDALNLVLDNIDHFIKIAVPDEDFDKLSADLTNNQLFEIVTIIIDVNFKSIAKKVGNLLQTMNNIPLSPPPIEKEPKKKPSKK